MSNIEDILATQNQLKEAIEQHLRNFKKDGAERKTPTYIKKRLETLDSYWVEFQANHTQLYQYEGRDYPYFTENDYLRTKEHYNDARSFIQQYQGNLHTREASPAKPVISITETQPQLLLQRLGEPSTYQEQPTTNKPTTFVKTKSQGNASKTDEMLRKQKSNFKAFTKTITTIDLDSINEKWEFDDTLKNLESRWKVIDSLHWEIDCETTGEELEYEQIYEIYERQYKDMKKAVNTKMWSVAHKQKSTPVMDLPTFGGAYHHWVSFKDLFTETVHTNPSLSSAQKMQYLKSKVKGEAEKLIQHLSISSDNYAVCWDILNNRYNNKKLIFTSHLSTILNLPTIQFQTSLAIKRVHDTAYECLNAIKNLGVDISTWDPIMVHLLSQKLDSDTYNDYIESLTEPRELPSLPEFLRYLEKKFTSLETARRKQERQTPEQQQRGSSSNNRFQPTYKAYSAKANQNFNSKPKSSNNSNNNYSTLRKTSYVPSNVRCPLCKNEHGLFHCNDFIKLHLNQRRNLVAKLNLCTNCLFDHKGKQCNSAKTCRQCNAQHHTLLHDTSVNSMPTASNDGHNNRNATTSSGHVSMEHMPETLLATALIKVKTHNGSEIVLRALIDQGSQVSLISENACQLLGLRRQRCKGVIFGVGTQENNCKGAVTISSTAINNNYNFDTYVYVMRNLINNLPNRSFPKSSSWKHLEGIQLADPDYNINQPIHILFGADVYSNIILSGVIKGEETQPIAQQTMLGWILCGNIKSYQCNVVLNNLDDISSFWKIEDIADNTLDMSSEDLYCLQQYKTKNGTLKRPVTKLSKLPVKEHESKEKQGESDSKQTESEENKQQNNDEQEQKTSETTKGRKSKRSCYLVWAIISILTFVSPARCDHSITNINKNQSIYFDKVTDMHLIRDEWKLVVYYDMAPFWQGIKIFKSYITSLETTCSSLKKQNQCELVILQLRHGFTELAHNNNVLLEQKLSITRQRRGLINGIGSIANSLFGVLDQNFAEKYEQDIALINKNEKHLALLWKNQTSIVEAENNILKRVEQMIEKQHKMYNQHLISLDKATNTIVSEVQDTKITNDFTLMSIIANSILINLKSLQETLLETVTDIHYGKLNIHILTPQQLTEELNIISGHLSKDLTLPIGNIHTDLRKLYHFLKVKARMSETYFIFEIKIPLVTRDFYDIYKLIPIPQQIQESMVTIEPIADRIAINLQKDAYLPMTENELQMCTPDNLVTLMCPLQRPIYHLISDDNLCVKNKETNQCETKQTTCTDMWIELYKINTYLYFCCGQRTIRIICEHQVTAERVSKAGIITLGEGCVIKGETFTIYSHTQRANYLRVQPDVIKVDIPPINYIFNITIPVIGTNKTADDELSTFKTELNQIDKQIEKMKSEGDGIDPITSHDVHQYALLYILLGTTLCVGGLFLWRRARARCSVTLPSASDNDRQPSVPAIQLVELPAVPETRRDDVESSVTRPYACVDKSTSPITNRLF